MNYKLLIIGFLMVFGLLTCQKIPVQSHVTSDSSWTVYGKDTLFVKSESVQKGINYDSIKYLLNDMLLKGVKPEIVYRNSAASPTSLTFKLDKGKLIADCTKADQLLEYLTKENNRLKTSYQVKILKEIPDWCKYALGGLAGISSLLLLLLLTKKV
jgi:hypothetical protein